MKYTIFGKIIIFKAMALLKMGSIVTQISGKVGGQTFGNGQAGQYLKNTGSYVNKVTSVRAQANSRLASLANSWRSLTTGQKASWSAAAPNFPYVNRIGETKQYSGYNLYMKFNGNRQIWGGAPVATAPTTFVFTEFFIGETVFTVDDVIVTIEDDVVGQEYVLFMSNPSSPGSDFNVKGLRFMDSQTGTGENVDFVVTSQYAAIFGAPKEGQKLFYRVFTYEKASGIKSGFYIDGSDIVTLV